jgi:hypothetical protein
LSKRVRVSSELVEDLNLGRFCEGGVFDPRRQWLDWHLIDRRRLKRELRKLPKLRAEAAAQFANRANR